MSKLNTSLLIKFMSPDRKSYYSIKFTFFFLYKTSLHNTHKKHVFVTAILLEAANFADFLRSLFLPFE